MSIKELCMLSASHIACMALSIRNWLITEQEVNGLLTVDHEPKVDPAIIKKANDFFIRSFVETPQKDQEIVDILEDNLD